MAVKYKGKIWTVLDPYGNELGLLHDYGEGCYFEQPSNYLNSADELQTILEAIDEVAKEQKRSLQ